MGDADGLGPSVAAQLFSDAYNHFPVTTFDQA
jgi:hypothetical protein